MILRQLPDPVKRFLDRATSLFDQRHADLVEPPFLGQLEKALDYVARDPMGCFWG